MERIHYSLAISRQQVEAHDPTKRCSKGLAKRWVTLFEDTRSGFRDAMVEIPVANRAFRLRALNRMLEEAEERGHISQALKLLEQAAKECGEVYVGRRTASEGASQVPATRVAVEFVHASERPPSELPRNPR